MAPRSRPRRLVFVIACVAAAVIIIGSIYAHSRTSSKPDMHSAPAVAAYYNCQGFRSWGPAAGGLVLDSGTCMIDGVKYGLDTFGGASARDAWLGQATLLGVVPVKQADTFVLYKSTDYGG